MNALSKYWNIWRISPADERRRYQCSVVPTAQEFVEKLLDPKTRLPGSTEIVSPEAAQTILFSQFRTHNAAIVLPDRAQAGLCLRCYVSEPILKACQKIASLFAGDKSFTYQDLLPFVLNDDGKALVILDDNDNTQLKLDDGSVQSATYEIFAVEVLRTYKLNSHSMSLDNWAFLQTKQHSELKNFLSEFGFQHLSDWALLNRVRPKQLEQLSERDRHLVEVFHAVYRRDRRQQQQVSRCLDPTDSQLTEMGDLLQQREVVLNSSLLKELKLVTKQLRQFDIWQSREPLEMQLETGGYELRVDLPSDSFNESDAEEQEFLEFLYQQLTVALTHAVEQAVQTQVSQLSKSKRYAPFATCFIPGLRLYYCEGLSLRDIGPQLGMSSWDQTRRILNPGEILSNVRRLTVQQLLEPILEKAQSKRLTSTPPEPSYLRTLTEQIEAFVDAEIFAEAVSEIKAGKNRLMDSIYAQQLKRYIEQTV